MIREFHLADFFTLANAACGVAAIFCAMIYVGSQSLGHFLAAAALAPAAFLFDVLDGRVARSRHTHSTLGRELDSLADVISFGVAGAGDQGPADELPAGWGHGVGMCQWGAKGMAEQGYTSRQILEFFYPGTSLGSLTDRAAQ